MISLATIHRLPIPAAWREGYVIFEAHFADTVNIWRIPVSNRTRRATGRAEQLTSGVGFERDPSAVTIGGKTLLAFGSVSEKVDLWSLPIVPDEAKLTSAAQRLTSGLGADVRPSMSGDGKKLVYNSNPNGNWDVWIKDLETGAERALIASEADEENPRLSPDGSQVVYRILENGTHVAYVVASRGGLRRKIADDCLTFPWSRDGRAFLCNSADNSHELVNIVSGERKEIAIATGAAVNLSWDDQWLTS